MYVSVTLSPGAFERTAATKRIGAVDRPVVDLGDHHTARQTRSRGRTVGDHVGDRRPVRAGILRQLNTQRRVRDVPFETNSSAMRLA